MTFNYKLCCSCQSYFTRCASPANLHNRQSSCPRCQSTYSGMYQCKFTVYTLKKWEKIAFILCEQFYEWYLIILFPYFFCKKSVSCPRNRPILGTIRPTHWHYTLGLHLSCNVRQLINTFLDIMANKLVSWYVIFINKLHGRSCKPPAWLLPTRDFTYLFSIYLFVDSTLTNRKKKVSKVCSRPCIGKGI